MWDDDDLLGHNFPNRLVGFKVRRIHLNENKKARIMMGSFLVQEFGHQEENTLMQIKLAFPVGLVFEAELRDSLYTNLCLLKTPNTPRGTRKPQQD